MNEAQQLLREFVRVGRLRTFGRLYRKYIDPNTYHDEYRYMKLEDVIYEQLQQKRDYSILIREAKKRLYNKSLYVK